ncbi:hypothetical protein ANO11243_020070 [Dothideomycetidae sp. 11243]|nr:hypothetical protein ANO11243_020070 [fungal sp. No.11243]
MKNAASLSAILALASSASAHMFISSPSPIPGSAPKDPLDGSGSNFPCHGVALPGAGGTQMAVGSSQLLAFELANGANTATHGGGSCQISITYETDPAKIKDPANWKVLYSIVGGCPTNSPANMDGQYTGVNGQTYTGAVSCTDPNTNGYDCVNQFNFTIPQGVQNGQATLAWTWFNNVGNREIYMNCVAVDITGGASDASQMAGLPDLFVANLASVGGGTCKTTEQQMVQFPNPGAYVTTKKLSTRIPVATAKDYPLVVPSGCGNVVDTPASSQAAGSAPTTAAAGAPSSSATTLATTTAAAGATSAGAGAGAPSASSSVPKKAGPGPTGGPAPAPAPSSAPAPAPAPATQGNCAAGSVPCTGLNSVMCVDQTHYGICDYNNCAISQPVAAGTICQNGAITWAKPARKRRHANKHAHAAAKHA